MTTAKYPSFQDNPIFIVAFWLFIALCLALWATVDWMPLKLSSGCLLGLLGLWRYSWQFVHLIRSKYYLHIKWPALRKIMDAHPNPYPQRLFFLIPSYKEKFPTTERMIHSVISEIKTLPTHVKVTLVINMASDPERDFIRQILKEAPEIEAATRVILMHQQDGKRAAMSNSLRTISRLFKDPLEWHEDIDHDLVMMMDGDSILSPGFLQKALPIFRIKPDVAAITPDNVIQSPKPKSLMHQWYKIKFSQRHFLFCSHSLSERVLTLTGRCSIYRANDIVHETFIRALESDYVDHWIFGRCRFLMGDDKSTWYQLLKDGHKMMYIPDAFIYCYEDRTDYFFKSTKSLLSRWYGNMLYNNGRATAVGVKKLGFFIWWCLLDQLITCWTPLIGPVTVLLLCLTRSFNYLIFYFAWVILTRLAFLLVLTTFNLELNIMHVPLLIYNQWYGAIIKLITLSRRDFQSWVAKDEKTAKMVKHSATKKDQLCFPVGRMVARYGMLASSFGLLVFFAYVLIFGIQIPDTLMLKSSLYTVAHATNDQPASKIAHSSKMRDPSLISPKWLKISQKSKSSVKLQNKY